MQFRVFIFLAFLFSAVSCTEDFSEINTNPNAPVDIQPAFLLRQVIFDYGEQMSFEGFVAGSLLGQYFTAVDFNLFDRHSLLEPQFGGNPWDLLYTKLRDNEIILDKSQENEAFAIYEGPALVMKAYIASAITDIYGDVPFSDAVSGKAGIISPTYDDQEDIYTGEQGLLKLLDEAIGSINNYEGAASLEGDILFQGDLDAWVRFANSLKIKLLMRISDVSSITTSIQSVYDTGRYIKTGDQNATYNFTDGQPNNFRMATARTGDFNIYVMSKTVEEVLVNYQDPRIATFFRPTANDDTNFAGLLNGPDASQTSITVGDYSFAGTVFRESTGSLDANFLTSFETLFLLAEAAERGFIFANAKELYEEGVRQAFEYWQTEMPADYLTDGPAAYDNDDKIKQIITQKWLANIVNGYEGWIEYRRTGFPELKIVAASLNNNEIPVRMPYPQAEAALNNVNYQNAADRVNNNSINARVWWDKE